MNSGAAEILRLAVVAAQAGEVERAQELAQRGLMNGGDPSSFHAFLGMLSARSGNLNSAAGHLRQAQKARPADVTIACNLISVLIDLGDMAGALEIATAGLARADTTLRVARYRGFAALSLDRFADAAAAYSHVVAHAPDDFESWNNLGNARVALEDFSGGVEALARAVEIDCDAPPTRLNLASALMAGGRIDEAEDVLRQAADDFPQDALPLQDLYVMLKQAGRHEDALEAVEQAAARDPDNPGLLLKLGIEYGIARNPAAAERAFRRAIANEPGMPDAYLGLIIQYEHSNREQDFAPLIELAEQNGVDEGALAFMRAMEFRRSGKFGEAMECLARVPTAIEPERTTHIRATLLDRMGRNDEAFEAFAAANSMHEAGPTSPLERAADLRMELEHEVRMLTPKWVAGWSDVRPTDDRPDPVFLVGFPRSGTTLLDTILMGHPDTVVLEEQPPLNLAEKTLGGFAGLAELSGNRIEDARHHYFAEVEKIQNVPEGAMLIDKSPLFLHKVPLIARLFPKARFILALRHPCDVILSCYMSNFRLNSAMANFLRLADAAAFYDLTFRYWERASAIFQIEVHTVVYERLVDNVEAEIRPLFDWLGLCWDERVLDHQRTAKARGLITTASYSQVIEPIYRRSSGRWRDYRAHLEPILPSLRPWVEKFGYQL